MIVIIRTTNVNIDVGARNPRKKVYTYKMIIAITKNKANNKKLYN